MIKRDLGATGMAISAIGWGGFAAGGYMWGTQDDADSAAAIRAALDAGVTWLDTAPLYGEGRADAVIGRVLREVPPSQRPHVFTKFGHHVVDGKRVTDGSRARVIADAEHALRTLGVEAIDLFQLHWPAPQAVEETAGACAELIAAGKVRHIGLCNADVALAEAWQHIVPVACIQNIYHLFRTADAERILPWCVERNVGFLAYSPLFRGMLSGTWTPAKTFPPGDHRGERDDFRGPRLARYLAAIEELKAVAAEDDLDVAGLAIGCLLVAEGLTGCIVGARNAAQGAALGQLATPVRAKQLEQVEAIVARCQADLAALPA